jgi:multiple sugar transport system ATP-binding protein
MVYLSLDVPQPSAHEDFAELARDAGDVTVDIADKTTVVARFSPRSTVAVGDSVKATVATDRMHFFEPQSGAAIWTA